MSPPCGLIEHSSQQFSLNFKGVLAYCNKEILHRMLFAVSEVLKNNDKEMIEPWHCTECATVIWHMKRRSRKEFDPQFPHFLKDE